MEVFKIILGPAITLVVGGLAYLIYRLQRNDFKRDIAKSILQEIRWAEDLINNYKENGRYKFTQKIILTNSWASNMHLFVSDLTSDEIDKISDLYSTGEYLDQIINKISDTKFNKNVDVFFKLLETGPVMIQSNQSDARVDDNKNKQTPIYSEVVPPWKFLLDEISDRHEPIYHSTIVGKLKLIARIR